MSPSVAPIVNALRPFTLLSIAHSFFSFAGSCDLRDGRRGSGDVYVTPEPWTPRPREPRRQLRLAFSPPAPDFPGRTKSAPVPPAPRVVVSTPPEWPPRSSPSGRGSTHGAVPTARVHSPRRRIPGPDARRDSARIHDRRRAPRRAERQRQRCSRDTRRRTVPPRLPLRASPEIAECHRRQPDQYHHTAERPLTR